MYGTLEPTSKGDPIELVKTRIRIGRKEGCDIVINYQNISSHHALMVLKEGYWFIRDLKSRNGVKVNGSKLNVGQNKRVDPDSEISFANREYVLRYDPKANGAIGTPPIDEHLGN